MGVTESETLRIFMIHLHYIYNEFNCLQSSMGRIKPQHLSGRVIDFWMDHGKDYKATFRHFDEEHKDRSNIRRIIKRFLKTGRKEPLKSTGRKPLGSCDENVQKVREFRRLNPDFSVRQTAEELGMTRRAVELCRKKSGIKSYRKRKSGSGTIEQRIRAQVNCRILSERFKEYKMVLIDDETYVPLDPADIPCQEWVSVEGQEELESLPDEILFQSKKRFFDKFMVWQTLAEDGSASRPYIMKGTMDGKKYKKVLKNYLIPFIQSKGLKFEKVLFWPDMSRVHYAECVQKLPEINWFRLCQVGRKCTIRTTRKTNWKILGTREERSENKLQN